MKWLMCRDVTDDLGNIFHVQKSITKLNKRKRFICSLPPGRHQWLLGVALEIHKESIQVNMLKVRLLAFGTKRKRIFAKGSTQL